jgi:hypothetical protein
VTPQSAVLNTNEFTDATGLVEQALATAGANGALIRFVNVASTDTAARKLYLKLQKAGGASRYGWIVNIPIQAGTKNDASVPSVAGLNRTQCPALCLDPNTNPFLLLGAGDKLMGVLDANCTAGLLVHVETVQEDF